MTYQLGVSFGRAERQAILDLIAASTESDGQRITEALRRLVQVDSIADSYRWSLLLLKASISERFGEQSMPDADQLQELAVEAVGSLDLSSFGVDADVAVQVAQFASGASREMPETPPGGIVVASALLAERVAVSLHGEEALRHVAELLDEIALRVARAASPDA